jgi:small subunit ribosomal protein S20
MPILKNAKKALRASKKKTLVNRNVKARMKTMMDHVKKEATLENLSKAFSAIDKAKKKNIIHKNKAAHLKSGLSTLLGKTEAPKSVTKKSSKSKKA